MASYYNCKRCNEFKTNNIFNIKKHLSRKYICKKKYENICYSDDQLLILSLIPYNNNLQNICMDEIDYLKMSNKIDKNKKELFNILEEIEKNKTKVCKFCQTEFLLITDLKKHVIIKCFYDDIVQKEEHEKYEKNNQTNNIHENNGTINGIQNNNITNINNNTNSNNTTNNTTNNFNIYMDKIKPVSFDDDWNLSNISDMMMSDIIISKYMYTKFLGEILKTDNNLNVIIDKENNYGMVYKNDIDKYIQMKFKDIILSTMEKLNKQLLDINEENKKNNSFDEVIDFSRKMINKKYIDFKNNDNIQKNIDILIGNIYESKKTDAIKIAKNIIDTNGFEGY